MNELDVTRIKKYNEELRHYKDKSANVRAQLELNKSELDRLCNELSVELNVQVTPENIEGIYAQCVDRVENNLKTGEEILNRIKAEEQQSAQTVIPNGQTSFISNQSQQVEQASVGGFNTIPNMFGSL